LACRFLARRAHSQEELAARLRRHGVSGAGIAATLDELKRQGYLDDAATAAQWARSWRIYKGWGPLRVRAEFVRRGLDRRLAERVLAELFPDDETEAAAMQIAVRLAGRPSFAGTGRRSALRLAAHLSRRGFPSDLARRVAARCCSGRNDDMIDADGSEP
jgi:regulatory protein